MSPSAGAEFAAVASRVVRAYATRGRLSFAYGQGSVFTGFSADSDLDIVMVWDSAIPDSRPVHELCDPGHEPTRFHEDEYALDKLFVSSREIDIFHCSRARFDDWISVVGAGDGWQRHAWPLPVHAVAGFVYGTDLHDPVGEAATIRAAIRRAPAELAVRAVTVVRDELPGYVELLDRASARSEGWLFHHLADDLIKHVYVAWFAIEGHYLPFPSHFPRWVERLGLDARIAGLERAVWTAPDLPARRAAIVAFAGAVIS